ncbi:MAG TPA: phosphatidylinositol mannoside acyltransferase [Acidimicrobiales bacterium]|nr:phosphatidylinositol mannoside acyltransferase [Acidimicrobiales bacterium]
MTALPPLSGGAPAPVAPEDPDLNRRPRRSPALTVLQAGATVARVLPPSWSRGLAEATAVIVSRGAQLAARPNAMAERRRMVARHLRRVYGPGVDQRRLSRGVDEAFASYGRYWAESLRLGTLAPERIHAGARYEGYEHLEAARAAGRGAIFALPHLGGWEWCGSDLAGRGHPMSVVVERLEPPDVFEWFLAFRERLGMQVIPAGPGAAAACTQALADNHVLCLVSDRVVGGASAVEVDFFGERTQLPAGPATLALRTGAVLLPCAVYFGASPDDHLGFIRPPVDLQRRGRLRDDVVAGTQVLAHEFESLIRRAPTQWHLMQPNWPSDLDGKVPPRPWARRQVAS